MGSSKSVLLGRRALIICMIVGLLGIMLTACTTTPDSGGDTEEEPTTETSTTEETTDEFSEAQSEEETADETAEETTDESSEAQSEEETADETAEETTDESSEAQSEEETATASDMSAPRRGGTIIVAIEADPPTLNPAITTDSNVLAVTSKLFNGLAVDSPAFLPVEGASLAESWDISDDGLTYTIQLQEGVEWHDGEPFTCADVEFSYTEVLPQYHPANQPLFQDTMESIECADDHTVVIQLNSPFPAFLSALKIDGGVILPKHLYEGTEITDNPHNMEPVGTGPFMLEEWVRGDHITLVRNPNYFKEGRPFLDRIIFQIIPDPEGTMTAFEAGEIDYIPDYRTLKSAINRLQEQPGVVVGMNLEPPKKVMLFFNLEDCEPCADVNVRQAIGHAINREQIIELTKFGLAEPLYNPIPPGYEWAHDESISEPRYDPDRANELLDEAGYERGEDGTRFSLTLAYQAGYTRVERPNEVLREQLQAVGIDLELNPRERNTMIDTVYHNYDFDVHDHLYSTGGDPALGISRAYTCDSIDSTSQFNNVTRYCNEEVDELFMQGATGVSLEERAEAYHAIQEIIVSELPVIDLFNPFDTHVSREEFPGLFLTAQPDDQAWDWVWWTGGEPLEEGSYEPIEFDESE